MNRREFLRVSLVGGVAANFARLAGAKRGKGRPNVVLIMGDDIGFADIGCFGSEIDTPNLDRIGMGGMRFSQFYNMAKCNPTRSSMLTGTFIGGENCRSLGQLMRESDYTTLYSGKEHFDPWVPERCKAMNSFDESFCHYGGAGPFFAYNAIEFHRNKRKLKFEEIENSSEPYYKTNVITDYALRFLDGTKGSDKPFFLYIPYESAHYPLHALPEDIAKFRGRYKKGWDVLRERRFAKQKRLGFFGDDTKLSPSMGLKEASDEAWRDKAVADAELKKDPTVYLPWESFSEKMKDWLDLEMAVFAGMVHCLDRNVGRVLDKLERMGELDNTLVMFLSDNGSCPFDRNQSDIPPGGPKSYRTISSAWANVGNTPFRYFKQNGHQGGAITHFMAHWPDVIKPGSICRETGHLVDIMPTMLELAGAKYPERADGKATPKLDGMSLVPLFKGKTRADHKLLVSGWTESKRMLRRGNFKAVTVSGGPWELYDMRYDQTELNDLSQRMPEKLEELLDAYEKWRAERPYLPRTQGGKER